MTAYAANSYATVYDQFDFRPSPHSSDCSTRIHHIYVHCDYFDESFNVQLEMIQFYETEKCPVKTKTKKQTILKLKTEKFLRRTRTDPSVFSISFATTCNERENSLESPFRSIGSHARCLCAPFDGQSTARCQRVLCVAPTKATKWGKIN